jgi:glycosyltransferase involved in cell wall biosynthesis/SAM-dependent methyltransferase
MEYTGERYLPWEPNAQASYEHYHRYLLALPFADGKRVLDLASGEGYGTALLAGVATAAIGIEKDPQAVIHAINHYIRSNLKFIQGSILDVPIQNQTFELITCFEAIEHVAEQEKVLDEVLRLLSEDGLLIISTPNKLVFSGESGKPWPWHTHEFDYVEFRNFLEMKFKDVIYLGQKVMMGSSVWPLQLSEAEPHSVGEIFVEKPEQGLRVVDAESQAPMFFLAIASKRDLTELRQSLKSSSLVDVSLGLLKEKDGWIEKLRRDIETLDAMVRSKDVELANLNLLVQARESELQEKLLEMDNLHERDVETLDTMVRSKDVELANLNLLVRARESELREKLLELDDLREIYSAAQAAHSASETEAASLKSQLEATHAYIQRKEQDLHIAAEFIAELHRSSIWRMLLHVRAVLDRVAPAGSPARGLIGGLKDIYQHIRYRTDSHLLHTSTPVEPAHVNERYAVCTIASKNYLGMVRVFAESVQRTNPGTPVYVLLADRVENRFDPANEPYHLITLDELDNIPNAQHFFFKYDPIELNTAAKPYFLEYLFRKFGVEKICYFDPDIMVFSGLDNLWKLMDIHSMVVTPHITAPYEDELHPNELELNLAGVFNLGFIGLANTPTSAAFLAWWQVRLYDYCYMNPSIGMHVDQNWVNFAPAMYADVFILRDPAYNIAYWNLHERGRRLRFEGDTLFIDHRPAVFYHFSGFDPDHMNAISRHQDRFVLADFPNLQPLFAYYQDLLQRNDFAGIKKWPYAFGRFDNDVRIPQLARVLYSRLSREQIHSFGDPFATSGPHTFFDWINLPGGYPGLTRLQMEIHRARVDLQKTFPDPSGADLEHFTGWLIANATKDHNLDQVFLPAFPTTRTTYLSDARQRWRNLLFALRQALKGPVTRLLPVNSKLLHWLRSMDKEYFGQPIHESRQIVAPREHDDYPFGVNIAGYLMGEFGVAEAARASIKSMEAAGISHVLNIADTHVHRHEDHMFIEFSEKNPYRINLVHVNADQSHVFAGWKGTGYFQEHYNIGYWFWELSQFPLKWRSSFDYYQEIWVASAFCQESIAKSSPVPVIKMTFPVMVDEIHARPDRSAFGLPEDAFLFGFVFDYLSLAERKNPMGLIKAFQQAFENHEHALLVIKTINAEYAPEKVALLKDLSKGYNIRFIDGHISRQEMTGLIASFDSFVSLHRSEGFGIGMAQAMYLGKPVIATGYSGNMDFMNHNNSYLVRYQLEELEQDYGPYEKGNVWADPDLDHAAELMQLVFTDRTGAQIIAARAEADIKKQMTVELAGAEMKARLLTLPG